MSRFHCRRLSMGSVLMSALLGEKCFGQGDVIRRRVAPRRIEPSGHLEFSLGRVVPEYLFFVNEKLHVLVSPRRGFKWLVTL